ncbi:MAG: hypothetical protein U0270_43080 [Labilithrix sp.]
MRAHASVRCLIAGLPVLVALAACGEAIDTTVTDETDAGADASSSDSGGAGDASSTDAKDADVDADAGVDADVDADAGAEPDDDAAVPCTQPTQLTETFPSPWSKDTNGWLERPAPPSFDVPAGADSYAYFQSTTVGAIPRPHLTHAIKPGCAFHLSTRMQIGGPAASLVDVTLFRIGMGSAAIELVRITTGLVMSRVVIGTVAGPSKIVGLFLADVGFVSLDVKVPAKGGVVSIVLNGATATEPLVVDGPTNITELKAGLIEVTVKNPPQNANFTAGLDDLTVDAN